jgi:hypothetical protein
MTTYKIGTTFAANSQWHYDEVNLVNGVLNQINKKFPEGNNLLINTTWFGPQFDNGEYNKLTKYTDINRLFFLAGVDPVMLNREQLAAISLKLGVTETYYIGNFDTDHQFTFIATLLPKYFQNYDENELVLKTPRYIFLNYNRKPRDHRTEFVDKLIANNLDKHGVITLGNKITLGEKIEDYREGNWGMPDTYGIPHDIHSLGNMELWQNHFLTVVSETEFCPWDNMFISEKTWKPILGLRPFIINGQTKIYKYLRSRGFKTFNHYFSEIELENLKEFEVHDSLVSAIKQLSLLDKKEIHAMYQDMLPDLQHNQLRFFEFAKEQRHKMNNLFV